MKILIYDVHASESGALAILDDLYKKIFYDSSKNQYMFVVSTPEYEEKDNIRVERYPWVKKGWVHRFYFDTITTRKILKRFNPDMVFSLQNKGISAFPGEQFVYLHLPFILCDYRFKLRRDGKRLWLYQNVLKWSIFHSLRFATKVIVQTEWMKNALAEKTKINSDRIIVKTPDITMNQIGKFANTSENRKRFFYPATAFNYKNHFTLLKAVKYAVEKGLDSYEVHFTIRKDENKYTQKLYEYVQKNELNVHFNGVIAREKVFEMYTQSVLLFPSFVESFGLPLLEAKLSDCYVIACDCPFSKEILNGYNKAFFFSPLDYNAMGEHILRVSSQEEL